MRLKATPTQVLSLAGNGVVIPAAPLFLPPLRTEVEATTWASSLKENTQENMVAGGSHQDCTMKEMHRCWR
ncbi:hypothetical protein BRADI_3g21017v3 [Brachypodium distachyon]|uniref:Uncharacterized protein n=1 Tax=Brachypodium distachyon TaxID=15368 RepID=A0A0Q3Q376_BRADI|nr:hypothetical protein BRADI_3g21017v3 [Brachypodium distachyon]